MKKIIFSCYLFFFCFFLFSEPFKAGIYQNNPKAFLNSKGEPDGFFIDITNEIARKNNLDIKYVFGTWEDNIKKLEKGELDFVLDVSYSSERAEKFLLNNVVVIESWIQTYSLMKTEIQDLNDFGGKTIAVIKSSVQESYLLTDFKEDYDIQFVAISVNDYNEMIEAVRSGKADLFLGDRFFDFSSDKPSYIISKPVFMRPRGLYYAFRKDFDINIIQKFDAALFTMKNDGDSFYYDSIGEWFSRSRDLKVPLSLKISIGVLINVIILAIFFIIRRNLSLKSQVVRQTAKYEESEARLEFLVKNSSDTLLIISSEGEQKFVSPSAEKVTGFTIEELKKPFVNFIHPDDIKQVMELWSECLKNPGKKYLAQYRHITKDNGWVYLEAVGQNYLNNPLIKGIILNVRDITERKKEEEEKIKLREELAQSLKMDSIGRLAGGVAHDFNNMLTAIIANTELGILQTNVNDPAYVLFEEIKKAAIKSADLTRQLLSFARKQAISPKIVNLNDAVSSMLTMLKRLIGENIELAWIPDSSIPSIKIDPSQIDQIMANLCVNSRDAIVDIGKITIQTGVIYFNEEDVASTPEIVPGRYVKLIVSDDGSGMSDDALFHLFEPFYTTKGAGKGTGLGLATVYGIVKQNKGYIYVENGEKNKGTTVKIYFPSYDELSELKTEEKSGDSIISQAVSILIVEDEPEIMQITTKLLTHFGYNIFSTNNPLEAIKIVEENKGEIKLLITDVIMPDMNGMDLSKKIITIDPQIKILFMSGYTANIIENRGALDEKTNFIQKPFPIEDLLRKIASILKS